MSKDLALRLDEALGITEEADSPKLPKPDGKSKKSSTGAHRFDSPVEFIEMDHDDVFRNGKLTGLTP